jgi:hypothetical protein
MHLHKKSQVHQILSIAKIDHRDSKTISNLCNLGHIFCANPFIKKIECVYKNKKLHIIQAHKKIPSCP